MDETNFTKKDFTNIKGRARQYFLEKPPENVDKEDFLCYCYVRAIKDYFYSKGLIMKDGFIYENQKTGENEPPEN